MAFIGLRVPLEAARLLSSVDVPGERQPPSDMHVTCVYLGKGVPMAQVAKAMVVLARVAAGFRPITFDLARVSNFPRNPDDGWPVICPVSSLELQRLHAEVKAALLQYGIPFSNKYPDYKPHVTLSYVRDGAPDFSVDEELPDPVPVAVHELTIWGGDRGPDQVMVTVPLTLTPLERAASRVSCLR